MRNKRCTDCIYYIGGTSKCFLLNVIIEDTSNPPCIAGEKAVGREAMVQPPSPQAPITAPTKVEGVPVQSLTLMAITSPWYGRVMISEEEYRRLGSPEYVLIRHGNFAVKVRVFPGRMKSGVIYLPTTVSRSLKLRGRSEVIVEPSS